VAVVEGVDAIAGGMSTRAPEGSPPSLVTTTMNPSTSATSSEPLDSARNRLIEPRTRPARISPAALRWSVGASAQPTLVRVLRPAVTRDSQVLRRS